MSKHVKLYIPGPVEVSADTYAAMSAPMIGHRGKGFQDLYAEIQPMLQTLFGTCSSSTFYPAHDFEAVVLGVYSLTFQDVSCLFYSFCLDILTLTRYYQDYSV